MSSNTDTIRELAQQEYKWGFVTDINEDRAPKGLNEDIIRFMTIRVEALEQGQSVMMRKRDDDDRGDRPDRGDRGRGPRPERSDRGPRRPRDDAMANEEASF